MPLERRHQDRDALPLIQQRIQCFSPCFRNVALPIGDESSGGVRIIKRRQGFDGGRLQLRSRLRFKNFAQDRTGRRVGRADGSRPIVRRLTMIPVYLAAVWISSGWVQVRRRLKEVRRRRGQNPLHRLSVRLADLAISIVLPTVD